VSYACSVPGRVRGDKHSIQTGGGDGAVKLGFNLGQAGGLNPWQFSCRSPSYVLKLMGLFTSLGLLPINEPWSAIP